MSSRILSKYFLKSEAEVISKYKDDVLSPICGAFMHLRALGDIDAFLAILIQNLVCFFNENQMPADIRGGGEGGAPVTQLFPTSSNHTKGEKQPPLSMFSLQTDEL